MNTNELFPGTWATYQWIHHWRTCYSFSWEPLTARHSSGRAGPHEPLPHLRWRVDSSIFCWSSTGSHSCYESHEDNCHPAFRKQLLRHSSPSSCLFSLFFSSSSMFHRPWDGRWCSSPFRTEHSAIPYSYHLDQFWVSASITVYWKSIHYIHAYKFSKKRYIKKKVL